ncbi:hypothetical protein [Candidatus Harpocratesius sp.]
MIVAGTRKKNIVLISIKPEYVRKIMLGEKKVEFRRIGWSADVDTVVIYASNPIKQIIGFFKIRGFGRDSPEKLWVRYEKVAGISKEDFDKYFSGKIWGYCYEIGDVFQFDDPVDPSKFFKDFRAPQKFKYLLQETFEELLQYGGIQ